MRAAIGNRHCVPTSVVMVCFFMLTFWLARTSPVWVSKVSSWLVVVSVVVRSRFETVVIGGPSYCWLSDKRECRSQ